MKNKYSERGALLAVLVCFLIIIFAVVQKASTPSVKGKGQVLAAKISVADSSSSTITSIQDQVEQLIQENTDLTNKIKELETTKDVQRLLKKGMSGEDVLAMQKLLQKIDESSTTPASGYFGKATEKSVKIFQEQEGLPITGIVNTTTLAHLGSSINDQTAPADSTKYDDLSSQLDDLSNTCSLATSLENSSQNSATSTDTSTPTSSIYGVCPAGCIAQDQVPDCSATAPDTTVVPDTSTAPVTPTPVTPVTPVTPPTSSSTTPSTTSTTSTSTSGSTQTAKTTTPTATPVSISNIGSSGITTTGAIITWTTNINSDGQVNYGTTSSYGQSSSLNSTMTTSHSVTLSGLSASTTYHFKVTSKGASGSAVSSADQTFTTTAPPPPVISGISANSPTSTSVTIIWTTDQNSDSNVDYGKTSSYGQSGNGSSSLTTSHSVTLTGLSPLTTYHYRVKSKNATGGLTTSADQSVTTIK